jgi:hypothetical protein
MRISGLFFVGILAIASTAARADESGRPIDLSNFSTLGMGDDAGLLWKS